MVQKRVAITGDISDAESGQKIADVEVQALDGTDGTVIARTRSDGNGHYAFLELFAGSYAMLFVKPTYAAYGVQSPGRTSPGSSHVVNATMTMLRNTISGIVSDVESGQVLADVTVKVLNSATSAEAYHATTDAEGKYSIGSVVVGSYKMLFEKPRYANSEVQSPGVTVGGSSYVVNAQLVSLKSVISGLVSDAETGQVLSQANVKVLNSDTGVVVYRPRGVDGKYSITHRSRYKCVLKNGLRS